MNERDRSAGLTQPGEEALVEAGWSAEEIGELREVLNALRRGELDSPAATTPAARVVASAVEVLARRLEPVLRLSRAVASAARRRAVPERAPGHLASDATESLDVAEVSLEELVHLTDRVGDVATQASVVALDVIVELERDGEVSHEKMADFADEVRRLADRTDVTTRRLPVVMRRLRSAHGTLRGRLEALQTGADHGAAELLVRGTVEVEDALARAVKLPADSRTVDVVERVGALRRQLVAEIAELTSSGVPPTAELEGELRDLETFLGRTLDEGVDP